MRPFMSWIPRMALVPDILPQLGGPFAFYSNLDDAAVAAGAPSLPPVHSSERPLRGRFASLHLKATTHSSAAHDNLVIAASPVAPHCLLALASMT
jgi:hypothetical protein